MSKVCNPTIGNAFDEAGMFDKMRTIGSPFGFFEQPSAVSRDFRDEMLKKANEYIVLTDDEKQYTVFNRDGFSRATGKNTLDEITNPEIIQSTSRAIGAGTAFHNVVDFVFQFLNNDKLNLLSLSTNDLEFKIFEHLKNSDLSSLTTNDVNIGKGKQTITVKYTDQALNDITKYIRYIIDDISQRADAAGYQLIDVDFYPEQRTANIYSNIAGTQDLLVVLPNNDGFVYDHKTSLRKETHQGPLKSNLSYNYRKYSNQLEQYTIGNSSFGVKTVAAFLMPILQVPVFGPVAGSANPNEIIMGSVLTSAMTYYQQDIKYYRPMATMTSVASIEGLNEASSAIAGLIEKMRNISKIPMNKPYGMDDTKWEELKQEMLSWYNDQNIRTTRYKSLFQSLTTQFDFSEILYIYDYLSKELETLSGIKGNLLTNLQNGTENFDTASFEIQELLRAYQSLVLEFSALEQFFTNTINFLINSIDTISSEQSHAAFYENLTGSFLYNYLKRQAGLNQGVIVSHPSSTLYFDPISNTWSAYRRSSDDVVISIDLSPNVLFDSQNANRMFDVLLSGGDQQVPKEFLFSDLFDRTDTIKVFFNENAPYVKIGMSRIYTNPQSALSDFLDKTSVDNFKSALMTSLLEGMLNEVSLESGHINNTLKVDAKKDIMDLIVSGVNKSHLTSEDLEKANVLFRSLNISELYMTSSELINHPIFELKNKILEGVRYDTNRQATEFRERANAIFLNYMKWQKRNNLSEYEARKKLIPDNSITFHQKYTSTFLQESDSAYLNDNRDFIFDNYDVDMDAYNQWFIQARKNIEEKYETMGVTNIPAALQDWFDSNELNFNKTKLNKAWTNKKLARFLKVKESRYGDVMTSDFKYIMANKELLDVYNIFMEMTALARDVVGDNIVTVTDEDAFLPLFNNDFSEMVMNSVNNGHIGGMFSAFGEAVIHGARTSPIDPVRGLSSQGDLANVNIVLFGNIPLVPISGHGLFDANEKETQEMSKLMSKDLNSIATQFIYSIYTYKQLKLTEPLALSMLHFMKSERYNETARAKNTTLIDKTGKVLKKSGLHDMLDSSDLFERYIYMDWYGIRYLDQKRKEKDIVVASQETGTGKGPITIKSLTMHLRNMYSRNVLGLAVIPAGAALLAGVASSFVNATESAYFDQKGIVSGIRKMFSSEERSKLNLIGKYFDVYNTPAHHLLAMQDKNLKNKALSDWYWYGPLRAVDMWITDGILSAVLDFWGIDANGNVKKLSELPTGTPSLATYFKYNKDTDKLEVIDEKVITKEVVFKIKHIVVTSTRDTYGQLPENQKIGLQFYFIGTLGLTFSSWMPGIINKRIGTESYDKVAGVLRVGRYRGLYQALSDPTRAKWTLSSLSNAILSIGKLLVSVAGVSSSIVTNETIMMRRFHKFKDTYPEEAAAMSEGIIEPNEAEKIQYEKYKLAIESAIRSMVVELRVLILVYLLAMAAKFDHDDDGEPLYKEYWAARQLFKVLSKTHTELIFLLDPKQISTFLNQPIAAFGILKDLVNVMTNTGDEVLDFIVGQPDKRDKTPPLYYSSKFIPGFMQLRRVFEIFAQDKENPYGD